MKYRPKVVSCGLSVLTATAGLIGAAGPLQAADKAVPRTTWFRIFSILTTLYLY